MSYKEKVKALRIKQRSYAKSHHKAIRQRLDLAIEQAHELGLDTKEHEGMHYSEMIPELFFIEACLSDFDSGFSEQVHKQITKLLYQYTNRSTKGDLLYGVGSEPRIQLRNLYEELLATDESFNFKVQLILAEEEDNA